MAGTPLGEFDSANSFRWISAVLQINQTAALLADSELGCIRLANFNTGELRPYSGKCKDTRRRPRTQVRDGPIDTATFSQPNMFYQTPYIAGEIVILDNQWVRSLNLEIQVVKTLQALSKRVNSIIYRPNSFIVAQNNKHLSVYDENWNFQKTLPQLTLSALTAALNGSSPFDYNSCKYNFKFDDLNDHILLLALKIHCEYWSNFGQEFPTPAAVTRAVGMFRISNFSLAFMLYIDDSQYNLLDDYPKTMAISKNRGLILNTNNANGSATTYCSLTKTLVIYGKHLGCRATYSQL